MMSHNDSCLRDLWESQSFLGNPVCNMPDPGVPPPAGPSRGLTHQESVLADVVAVWDRRAETEQGSCK